MFISFPQKFEDSLKTKLRNLKIISINKMTIQKSTLEFFKEISENNHKAWFEANKGRYEIARENFLGFMQDLLEDIRKIEPIYEKEPKKYADRIYRDIRFSKDKSPYKDHISCLIERAPDNQKCPFYIQVKPGGTFIGGGVWQPEADLLKKVRQEIDYNGSEFNTILHKPSFVELFGKLSGDALARPPKGYEPTHPNVELLKLKQYIVHRNFDNDLVCSDNFKPALIQCYAEALPFFHFFDVVKQEQLASNN